MTTSWLTARARIATILDGVSITTPIATDIKKAYETPTDNIADYPCAMIVDAARRTIRGNGLREKIYDVRIRLMVRDANVDRAAEILDSFEEAMINTFDTATRLNLADNYHVMEGPNWEEKQTFDEAAGAKVRGVDGILIMKVKDAVAFAA